MSVKPLFYPHVACQPWLRPDVLDPNQVINCWREPYVPGFGLSWTGNQRYVLPPRGAYALPRLPSTFQCSAPYTFLQPHFHLGCCSGGVHHGPHCHGCSGACSSPFSRVFYSRLFAMWLSSGSWRPVMTLSHLLCFCDSVSISDGVHSVCAPVSMSGDWMAYLVLRAAFLQVPVHPASRHLLRFLF